MAKRKSPKEIIESTKEPHNEHAYIKYPRENLKDTTKSSDPWQVEPSYFKKILSWSLHGTKPYTALHTYPRKYSGSALPSDGDLRNFLISEDQLAKTTIITQQDPASGNLEGYTVIKKTKKTPSYISSCPSGKRRKSSYEDYDQSHVFRDAEEYFDKISGDGRNSNAVLDFAKKYHLKVRFVPAKGYTFDKDNGDFVPLKKSRGDMDVSLERKVGSIIGISLLGSIIFSSANITGYTISGITPKTINLLGAFLFIFGVVVSCFYLRRRW